MGKKLIAAAAVAAGLAVGLAPAATADDLSRQVCLAVMAGGVNPNNPNDNYALFLVQQNPNMTYNQASDLVRKAFGSVRYHDNPMCNGVTIPENY